MQTTRTFPAIHDNEGGFTVNVTGSGHEVQVGVRYQYNSRKGAQMFVSFNSNALDKYGVLTLQAPSAHILSELIAEAAQIAAAIERWDGKARDISAVVSDWQGYRCAGEGSPTPGEEWKRR